MDDIQSILSTHPPTQSGKKPVKAERKASMSAIPDIFFDEILVRVALTRVEVLTLMYLYRITWCKPNLHKKYGITPMIEHSELCLALSITNDVLYQTLRKLEGFGFIETIHSGQYFVRKFFSVENDLKYGQTYDNFL